MEKPATSKPAPRPSSGRIQQPPSYFVLILLHPLRLLLAIYYTLGLLLPTLIYRLLLPTACSPTSFKLEIQRCWIAGLLVHFHDLMFKAPLEWPSWLGGKRRYELLMMGPNKIPAVVVPPNGLSLIPGPAQQNQGLTSDVPNGSAGSLTTKSMETLVLLWAHGGGFLFGEPLQYLSTYERWSQKAQAKGWNLVICSVDYRLSSEAKWPACRDDFLDAYTSLLVDFDIDPKHIVFGGDSAGGSLVAMSALQARRQGLSSPRGLLMVSPWLDLTLSKTRLSPAMCTDYVVEFTTGNPEIVKQLLPQGLSPNSHLVSPIFDDLAGLPPQLVLAGTAEVLLPDSEEWEQRSRMAGNDVRLIREDRQMHIYAMGWPFSFSDVQRKADADILGFLSQFLVK